MLLIMDISAYRVEDLPTNCYDLGCWTLCNGTDRLLEPSVMFDGQEFMYYMMVLLWALNALVGLYLLFLFCLLILSRYQDRTIRS